MIQIYGAMREGIGKFINRKSKVAGKEYDSFFIYVPAEVARDSQCPFKHGDKLKIIINGDTFIIEKVDSPQDLA
ncbi:hypothetical protein ANME2D_03354 [Candidatus Methanoperedens nitroreducens]|uniref:Uncharacterized protein n=1 Tax=Candidatus Methanoperedens nitratireducens TaxID=1392998 RepID=A0A062V3S6_9EURY|nr:hypothetical protein [Candidatus Methanoperedens nitroreducens]KCZ70439.1 hypothetical protein ANME2D_03354 [Candidatus Methanoperedens nitroreducens]MDJ1420877.1 hypothetical protein [Candidatus Methanoperedens sp.]